MIYTSVENEKIKEIHKLQTKKYRDLTNNFIVEGEHLVAEAYKSGLLKMIVKLTDYSSERDYDVETVICSDKIMRYLSELDTPSKIIGVCTKKNGHLMGEKLLLLDNVQDPGNLGTIIRSCVAFEIDTLILSKDCVDLYNSKVIRASQGMLFNCNIIIDDLEKVIKDLNGYTIYGTKVDGGQNSKGALTEDKIAVIMGNEGNGISENLLNLCNKFLYIKMNKNCESLNVAIATSIILYELDK